MCQAAAARPDFDSALFNLALLLSDSGRPLEAAPFLHQLIQHQPDHIKALLLLGDIYVNKREGSGRGRTGEWVLSSSD